MERLARLFSLLAVSAVIIAGCGTGSDRIYDTARNPHNFPDLALSLIDDLDAGELTVAREITERYSEVHLKHYWLMGDSNWLSVTRAFAERWEAIADSLLAVGPSAYSTAVGYLRLVAAAFTEDTARAEEARLFGFWTQYADNGLGPVWRDGEQPLSEVIAMLRIFVVSGPGEATFARRFLLAPTLAKFSESDFETLEPADRLLLAALRDTVDAPLPDPLAVYTHSACALVEARATVDADGWFVVETYWRIMGPQPIDHRMAARLFSSDSAFVAVTKDQPYMTLLVHPHLGWAGKDLGSLTLLSKGGEARIAIDSVQIALLRREPGNPEVLPDDRSSAFLTVPLTRLP